MILGKVDVNIDINDLKIEEQDIFEGKSFYNVVESLVENKSLIIIGEELVYAEDIRANYRDKELYLPVFKCETIEEDGIKVDYNNRIEKYVIHDKNGWKIESMTVIPNRLFNKAFEIPLSNRKLSREVSKKDIQAEDLFNRYIAISYGYSENEMDIEKYVYVQRKNLNYKQKKLLKEKGLEYYGEYIDMDYRDVRRYKLFELNNQFDNDILKTEQSFRTRRIKFELELYSRAYDKVYWENWSHGKMEDLIEGKREYIKHKVGKFYLIAKRHWFV